MCLAFTRSSSVSFSDISFATQVSSHSSMNALLITVFACSYFMANDGFLTMSVNAISSSKCVLEDIAFKRLD